MMTPTYLPYYQNPALSLASPSRADSPNLANSVASPVVKPAASPVMNGSSSLVAPTQPPSPYLSPYVETFPNRVFVGSLPPHTSEADLRSLFIKYGNVRDVKIVRQTEGSTKGYAFVTFETEEEALKVLKMEKEDLQVKGRRLNVGEAKRKFVPYLHYNTYYMPGSPYGYTYPAYYSSPVQGSYCSYPLTPYSSNGHYFSPLSNDSPSPMGRSNSLVLDALTEDCQRQLAFDDVQLESTQKASSHATLSDVSLNMAEFPPLQ